MKAPYFKLNHEFAFQTEKPIETNDEDGLNINYFAQNLAVNIQNYFKYNHHCLTIGLIGGWGSGKTSILNLTKGHLKTSNIKIMEFNPWIYSSYNQLIEQFFDELIFQFSDGSGMAKYLNEYRLKLNKSNLVKSILPTVTSIKNPKLGNILAKTLNMDSEEKSLEKIRNNINNEIKNHKIVCIIDDLDRLNSDEINEMFKLIKIMANFNNIVYLIAFDKTIISNALDEQYGENFIDKIINVPLEVPFISQIELGSILEKELNNLSKKHEIQLDEIKLEEYLDSDYDSYTTEANNGILNFFKTIRDIKRFINILEFNLELIKNEVNFVDFIAITAIQMFKPDLYEKIRYNESLLVMCPFSKKDYTSNYELCQSEQNEFERIVDGDDNSKYILQVMFPKMRFIYDVNDPLYFSAYDASLSICHKNHFKTYFKLNPILKEINEYEISLTLDLINSKNETGLFKQFKSLDEMEKLKLLFKSLKNRTDKVTEKEFLLDAIFSFYKIFDEKRMNRIDKVLHKLCLKLIYKLDCEDRFDILRDEFASSNQLEFLFLIAFHFKSEYERNDYAHYDESLFDAAQINELETIVKDKFKVMLDVHSDYVEENLVSVLDLGGCIGLTSEIDEFIKNYLSSAENLIAFLKLFISESGEFSEREIQKLSDLINLNIVKDEIDENYDELADEIVVKKFLKGHELWLDDVID